MQTNKILYYNIDAIHNNTEGTILFELCGKRKNLSFERKERYKEGQKRALD